MTTEPYEPTAVRSSPFTSKPKRMARGSNAATATLQSEPFVQLVGNYAQSVHSASDWFSPPSTDPSPVTPLSAGGMAALYVGPGSVSLLSAQARANTVRRELAAIECSAFIRAPVHRRHTR